MHYILYYIFHRLTSGTWSWKERTVLQHKFFISLLTVRVFRFQAFRFDYRHVKHHNGRLENTRQMILEKTIQQNHVLAIYTIQCYRFWRRASYYYQRFKIYFSNTGTEKKKEKSLIKENHTKNKMFVGTLTFDRHIYFIYIMIKRRNKTYDLCVRTF